MIINKEDPRYKQCTLTVMDNIADPDIRFDPKGVSNYYYEYHEAAKVGVLTGEAGRIRLESLVK